MKKTPRRFGCWPSKISAGLVAGKNLRFQTVHASGQDLYWSESRPDEDGRCALLLSQENSPPRDILPSPWSVRTRVHEYGGNAFVVTDRAVFFVNDKDQQVWSLEKTPSGTFSPPEQITDNADYRYADPVFDPERNRLVCIGERLNNGGASTCPDNMIIAIGLDDHCRGQISILVEGEDFYASPRLSPDGDRLAFLSWNLPHMPWERARLQIARLDKKGNAAAISCPDAALRGASFQPEWDSNGFLWFINDDSGYGRIYRHDGDGQDFGCVVRPDGEAGLPLWVFGMKTYGFLDDGRIACASLSKGMTRLALIDPASGEQHLLGEFCAVDQIVTMGQQLAGIISRQSAGDAIFRIDCRSGQRTLVKPATDEELPASSISTARSLCFENEVEQKVFGQYYPPCNPSFQGNDEELPPVILSAHGGPTAFADCRLKPRIQFWTSRGFGYFDVNYSGSWGFGRAYRERLDGQWGVRDVADMTAAARYLIRKKLADPARLLLSGSSAGGYTVLMTLVTSDLFAAGASYYGISDLARLCHSTHKFEAGYLDTLLGLTPENREKILKKRSPLFNAERISSPVIFFQGLQDKVVPADQAELMVKALVERGVETGYHEFANEGHGFRSARAIATSLNMEYEFYSRIIGHDNAT